MTESDEFKVWLQGQHDCLWLSGIPGSGKTVLTSHIIENTQLHCLDASEACVYFYCDYKDPESQDVKNILGSLVAQLAACNTDAFSQLEKHYNACQAHSALPKPPDQQSLIEIFSKMSQFFDSIYVIVDGIGECGNDARKVAQAVVDLTLRNWIAGSVVPVALLSREEEDLRSLFATHAVHIEIAAKSGDLQLFVSEEIEKRMRNGTLEISSIELKDTILSKLVGGAQGM